MMNRLSTVTVEQDGRRKSEWVTPVLSRMSVENTLSGGPNTPAETMSGNPSGRVPGGDNNGS